MLCVPLLYQRLMNRFSVLGGRYMLLFNYRCNISNQDVAHRNNPICYQKIIGNRAIHCITEVVGNTTNST